MAGHSEEVERLARTLRANKVVQSESEAYRMANDMLATSKKVHEDFKKRDEMYSNPAPKNNEMEKAHLIMEKLTENLAKGKSNVRIDMGELDLEKPLKELIPGDDSIHREAPEEEDDAVLINSPELEQSAEATEELKMPAIIEAPKKEDGQDGDLFGGDGDDDDDGSEEEHAGEEKESSEEDFSVREI